MASCLLSCTIGLHKSGYFLFLHENIWCGYLLEASWQTFFLFLHENICCSYSLEAPHRGASNEYQ